MNKRMNGIKLVLSAIAALGFFAASAAAQRPQGQSNHKRGDQGQSQTAQADQSVPQNASLQAQAAAKAKALKVSDDRGEFFLISSINTTKHEIVLKRPTEVTLLVQVDDKTQFADEQGQILKLGDLRAGDTVYVTLKQQSGTTEPIVLRIHKSPMTVAELHKRFLHY